MEYPSALPRGKRAVPFCLALRAGLTGLLACALVSNGLWGCGGRAGADDPSRFPVFGPADAILFDDRLVLEPTLENSYRADPGAKLRERVRRADAVLRARVGSVTRASANQGVVYALVVHPVGPALAGEFSKGPFTLTVTSDEPAFSAIRQLDRRLIAKTLVLFLKRYNGGPRQVTLRWHAEPDSPGLHALVQGAARDTASE